MMLDAYVICKIHNSIQQMYIHMYWLIRAPAKNGLWGVGPRHNSRKSPNELHKMQ